MNGPITPTFALYEQLVKQARDDTGFAIDVDLQDMALTMVQATGLAFVAATTIHDADVWDALLTSIRGHWRYVRCWILDGGLHIYGIYAR